MKLSEKIQLALNEKDLYYSLVWAIKEDVEKIEAQLEEKDRENQALKRMAVQFFSEKGYTMRASVAYVEEQLTK